MTRYALIVTVALVGCGAPPTTAEQASECREACQQVNLPVLRMEERDGSYMNGQIAWRCVCGEPKR